MKGTNGKFVEKISISFDCFWKWENNGRQTRGTMIIFSAQYFSNFGMSVCFLRMNYGKNYGPVYNGNMNRYICISYLIESQRTLALAMLITGDTRKFRKSVPTSHTRGWLSLKVNWNTQNHITMITDPVSDNVYFTGRMQGVRIYSLLAWKLLLFSAHIWGRRPSYHRDWACYNFEVYQVWNKLENETTHAWLEMQSKQSFRRLCDNPDQRQIRTEDQIRTKDKFGPNFEIRPKLFR